MDASHFQVPVEQLRWRCDADCFTFQCTDELVPLQEFIGQDRAISAIEFGLGVDQPGYNIFVAGIDGTGKSSVVKAHLEGLIKVKKERGEAPIPGDWCYVHNFADADRPKIVELPAGLGRRFKSRIARLREELSHAVDQAFSGEDYDAQRKALAQEGQEVQRTLFQQLEQEARAQSFTVQFSPAGVAILPVKDGKPLTQEEFLQIPEATRKELEERRGELSKRVEEALEKTRELELEVGQKVADLNQRVAEFATAGVFNAGRREFSEHPRILAYLQELQGFSIENFDAFRQQPLEPQAPPSPMSQFQQATRAAREREVELPFSINVIVDNADVEGPPIVVENNPTFPNLFGKIDRRFVLGGYVTDHTMLKAGSIGQANGGYLVLNIREVLLNPMVWETLKRVIKTKEVRPEDPNEVMGFVVPQGIKPEPMPLEVKVVVTGDARAYNLLSAYDEQFWETFKVKADFDSQITRSPDHLDGYAAFICRSCHERGLRHFEREAVAEVVEHAARLVADQRKLSTRFGMLRDLLIEADYWARKEDAPRVTAANVAKALEQKHFRSNLVSERLNELIAEGSILVDVAGEEVGQINGLAVYTGGDIAFGKPARITARTFLGRGGVINIEREAKLSGATHDKGVLILSGYLGWKYAQDRPLSVSVSIAFEQSYAGVDGDSASSTEIYAILSSLSGRPIKQNLAVTGSVNQAGEIQPIGGVNEKIEGFFDVCKLVGLTGDQGVIVPKQNVPNLMLRPDVVEAIAAGQFQVYSVGTVDEGIEVLTGVPAGQRDEGGRFAEGTMNYLVDQRLADYGKAQQAFMGRNGGTEAEEEAPSREEEEKAPAQHGRSRH